MNQFNYNVIRNKVEDFKNGKRDFEPTDLIDIKLYLQLYKDQLNNTEFFTGVIQKYKIVSCFADNFHDELHEYVFKDHAAAISIIVMIDNKEVYIKLNKSICNINICKFAQQLCNGDCIDVTESIAKGKLTDKFLRLSANLQPCKQ